MVIDKMDQYRKTIKNVIEEIYRGYVSRNI